MLAVKSTVQSFKVDDRIASLMETFRQMTNKCIDIGIAIDCSTMKRLSKLCYHELASFNIVAYYKLTAISRAAGILASRKKSIRRGRKVKSPYATKPSLVGIYKFKIRDDMLKVPMGNRQHFDIPLNHHVKHILSNPTLKVRSFMLAANGNYTVSICYSKEVAEIECTKTVGIDRNLENLTVGNADGITQYNLSKASKVAENNKDIVASFKRNDVRIRKKIAGKYGRRRRNRVQQLLHHVSKMVVQKSKQDKTAIAFEDIRFIRSMYQKGNYQGRQYRGRMNGWSFAEIKRQIEYKAAWEGVPIIQLTKCETRGTSKLCPRCGELLQVGQSRRTLWCDECKREMDRDLVAAMNIAYKGLARFASSKGACR